MATTPTTFTNDIAKLEVIYLKAVIARELKTTRKRVSNQICRLAARRDQTIRPFFQMKAVFDSLR